VGGARAKGECNDKQQIPTGGQTKSKSNSNSRSSLRGRMTIVVALDCLGRESKYGEHIPGAKEDAEKRLCGLRRENPGLSPLNLSLFRGAEAPHSHPKNKCNDFFSNL
jgi:hypothetical protein